MKPIALRLEDAAPGRFQNLQDKDRERINNIARKTDKLPTLFYKVFKKTPKLLLV